MKHIWKPKPWRIAIDLFTHKFIYIVDRRNDTTIYWESADKRSWGRYEYDENGEETYFESSSGERRIMGIYTRWITS